MEHTIPTTDDELTRLHIKLPVGLKAACVMLAAQQTLANGKRVTTNKWIVEALRGAVVHANGAGVVAAVPTDLDALQKELKALKRDVAANGKAIERQREGT
jgi:hypothetical protein